MSIIQFLRILWARKWIVGACAVFTLLGGVIVTLVVPPRYEASSRVMLKILEPDPVTGRESTLLNLGPYIATQNELMKDYSVTGPVVDQLGWLSDPNKIAAYQSRPSGDNRDFRRWLAQQVADHTSTELVSGTILEIRFNSASPNEAKVAAEALRQSYMEYSLAARRRDAARNAEWYSQQAEVAQKRAEDAQVAKANFERENGIIMQGDRAGAEQDLDSSRLAALVAAAAAAPTARMSASVTTQSTAGLQLAQIDAALAQNAEKLGPNHPQMQQLRAQRALVASVVAQEQAAARAGPSNTAATEALNHALAAQTTKVISERDKIERLRQLQSEVDLRRDQYKKTAERAAELSLEAGVADPGMTSMGVVVPPTTPSFPKKRLIILGSLALGTAFGLALSILVELLNRRVRGAEDLNADPAVGCLAIVGSAAGKRPRRFPFIPSPAGAAA